MRRMMSVMAAVALIASAALCSAEAAPAPYLNLQRAEGSALPIEKTQYYWGGQNYCWYPNGWRGPGWYWCGYAFTYGYGWGGGYGWRGWGVPGGWNGGWHGGYPGWHGGYPGWHGGGIYHGHGGYPGYHGGGVYHGGGMYHGGGGMYHGGGGRAFHGGGMHR
jgi:hypothetical protein